MANFVDVRLFAYDQAGCLHVLPQLFPGCEAIQPGIGAGGCVERSVLVGDIYIGQVMALGDQVVVGIVTGRHFERAGPELRVNVLIGNNGNLSLQHRHKSGLADQMGVAFVLGMDGDGRVAQDRLWPGCADLDVAGRGCRTVSLAQRIAEGVELALDRLMFDFQVADSALTAGTPVDKVIAAINEPVVVEADEGLEDGVAETVVKGKAFSAPVARNSHTALLAADLAVIFVLPVPHLLHEAFPSQVVTGSTAFGQFAFDDILGGDSGMIGARHPQSRPAGHAVIADQHVLDGAGDGMAQMEYASYIGRRHGDDERRRVGVGKTAFDLLFRAKKAHRLPPCVQLLFPLLRFINLGHFRLRFKRTCVFHCPCSPVHDSPSSINRYSYVTVNCRSAVLQGR